MLDDLPFEEVVVKACRSLLRLGDIFHIEIEPQNSDGGLNVAGADECRQERANDDPRSSC